MVVVVIISVVEPVAERSNLSLMERVYSVFLPDRKSPSTVEIPDRTTVVEVEVVQKDKVVIQVVLVVDKETLTQDLVQVDQAVQGLQVLRVKDLLVVLHYGEQVVVEVVQEL